MKRIDENTNIVSHDLTRGGIVYYFPIAGKYYWNAFDGEDNDVAEGYAPTPAYCITEANIALLRAIGE